MKLWLTIFYFDETLLLAKIVDVPRGDAGFVSEQWSME